MKKVFVAAVLALGAVGLSSCATMSEDQCLAGAWGEVGFADGAAGYPASRLSEHAQACARHGVAPDEAIYYSARNDGLRRYCTPAGGFEAGRTGRGYAGVCPADLERAFLPAFRDGEIVHAAEAELSSIRSAISSARSTIDDRQDKIQGKERELRQEGLTEDQKAEIRNRIRELRREVDDARRDERRAEDALRDAEWRVRDVRYRFQDIYGAW